MKEITLTTAAIQLATNLAFTQGTASKTNECRVINTSINYFARFGGEALAAVLPFVNVSLETIKAKLPFIIVSSETIKAKLPFTKANAETSIIKYFIKTNFA